MIQSPDVLVVGGGIGAEGQMVTFGRVAQVSATHEYP